MNIPNILLKACINQLTPKQADEILEELPFLRERGFPDEGSTNEILWSYTDENQAPSSILYDDRLLDLSKHNAIVMSGLHTVRHDATTETEILIRMVLATAAAYEVLFDKLVLLQQRSLSPPARVLDLKLGMTESGHVLLVPPRQLNETDNELAARSMKINFKEP